MQGDTSGALPVAGSAMFSAAQLESGAGKIKHVVYVVQENRSFDDIFQGYPGADTVSSGKDSTRQDDRAAAGLA